MFKHVHKNTSLRQSGDAGHWQHDVEEYEDKLNQQYEEAPNVAAEVLGSGERSPSAVGSHSQPEGNEIHPVFDFNSKYLSEIDKRVNDAIEEHKTTITTEYKTLKRELDIEKGNLKSQLKLAKKERRSEKTLAQRAKAEHACRKASMIKLHGVLMKHHFSLVHVEEDCMKAYKLECMNYVNKVNKIEMSLWKRICQDIHTTLDTAITGFTVQRKWKKVVEVIRELQELMSEGKAELCRLYERHGIKPDMYIDGGVTWKPAHTLQEMGDRMVAMQGNKKKRTVANWGPVSEEWKVTLGKHTLLMRREQQRRLDLMEDYCTARLNSAQKNSTVRHGKLMQKIAKEQQLLDKSRMEVKGRQKKMEARRSDSTLDQRTDTRPPLRMPDAMGQAMGGPFGGRNPYTPANMGGNFNMSNAEDVQTLGSMDNLATELMTAGVGKASNVEEEIPEIAVEKATSEQSMQREASESGAENVMSEQGVKKYSSEKGVEKEQGTERDASEKDKSPTRVVSSRLVYREDLYHECSSPAVLSNSLIDQPQHHSVEAKVEGVTLKLTQANLAHLPLINKMAAIEKYLYSEKDQTVVNSDRQHPLTTNCNANTANTGSAYNRNVNADSSDESSTPKGKKKAKGNEKKGGFASRLFGLGKKTSKAPSTPSSTGSGPDSSSEGSYSGSDDSDDDSESLSGSASSRDYNSDPPPKRPAKGATRQPAQAVTDAGDTEYKEFVANEHKDKWSLKNLCRCCNMDAIVNRVCPCLKEQYKDFKERREEARHKKAMRKNVLLRLRDEASRSRA